MEDWRNPFAPGAGNPPPELAGRSQILGQTEFALRRLKSGMHGRGQMLLGLRGVGKTVLLNRIEAIAEAQGEQVAFIEAPDRERLASQLVPALRKMLLQLSKVEKARSAVGDALGALRNFASMFKVSMGDVEFSIDPALGVADSGDMSLDLTDLVMVVAQAARSADKAAVLLVDEVQYLSKAELGAIIVAFHRVSQKQLPFLFIGAGLPQLAGLSGDAKSYAERLFHYSSVGALEDIDARAALSEPVEQLDVQFTDEALKAIIDLTQGYPYFLQEWGFHCWNKASMKTVVLRDVQAATPLALARLDDGFFRVRLNRLTPREKAYVHAMATLGPGPHRAGAIAKAMGQNGRQVAQLKSSLVEKGMIYSPNHGDTAFTVPLFDEFLKRAMNAGVRSVRREI